jgi:hypothetical protein
MQAAQSATVKRTRLVKDIAPFILRLAMCQKPRREVISATVAGSVCCFEKVTERPRQFPDELRPIRSDGLQLEQR